MNLKFLMNPEFWNSPAGGAITSFGFPMLARMFGAGRAEEDFYNEMKKLMGDETRQNFYNQRYGELERLAIPDRAGILADSNMLVNNLQSAYARSGNSGIGATAATLGGMVAGNEYRRLNAGIRQGAMELAQNDQMNRVNMLKAIGPRPTPGLDALAHGIDDFGGFLNDYFAQQRRQKPVSAGSQLSLGMPNIPRYGGPRRRVPQGYTF